MFLVGKMSKSDKNLIDLYKEMQYIRMVEETIAERYPDGKMRCPTHLSTGQEAVAVGVAAALSDKDYAMSTHRCHAHYLAKGGDVNRMIAELYGKATGCAAGKGGSMHLIDQAVGFMGSTSIVGNSIPIAVGLGLSIKLEGSDRISCVFFGEAALETGAFYESINFALLKSLPVLFVCENNLYSVYSPLKVRQPGDREISSLVRGLGVSCEYGDGNNAAEVFEKSRKAVGTIQREGGPYFLEFPTYRWREHCGPFFDNDLGYRTEKEFEEWLERDPLLQAQVSLQAEKLVTDKDLERFLRENQKVVDEAFAFAEASPFPSEEEAYLGEYA